MFRDGSRDHTQWGYDEETKRTPWRFIDSQEQDPLALPSHHETQAVRDAARQRPVYRSTTSSCWSRFTYGLLLTAIPTVVAQSCIPLADSAQCPAFNASSISTDSTLTGLFPFLARVTDVASFDSQIQQYIAGSYSSQHYQNLIGCSAYDSSNTTRYYARYTTSVLCNAVVQNSVGPCALTGSAARPLCADTCSEYAQSEESISASNYCGTAGPNAMSQIRADFTNCALPADSLSGSCIEGVANEPNNCGFMSNTGSLCSYCAASSPNSTDSCCVFSDTETRCSGVVLPVIATSSMQPLFTSSTPSPTSSSTISPTAASSRNRGLTGGQVAGIVVGSILGAAMLLALLIFACIFFRRRQRNSPANSVSNQPAQARQPQMTYQNDGARSEGGRIDVLPGGRVARMSAIEGTSSESETRGNSSPGEQDAHPKSSSDEQTPRSFAGMVPPPRRRRSASLSGSSVLGLGGGDAPSPGDAFSSPDTNQSEQLDFFKDYYSQDEIHPYDYVATLWAYQPRAGDEFELERGDMIKVLGIWDDGWATGVRVRTHAEDWRENDKLLRDSGMSGSPTNSPQEYGEVKAFPLVCVCLPQHWRKTIEGDSTEATEGTADEPPFGST